MEDDPIEEDLTALEAALANAEEELHAAKLHAYSVFAKFKEAKADYLRKQQIVINLRHANSLQHMNIESQEEIIPTQVISK